jgi:hypothetical protein
MTRRHVTCDYEGPYLSVLIEVFSDLNHEDTRVNTV